MDTRSMTDARQEWVEQAAIRGLPMPSRDEMAAFADGYAAAIAHLSSPLEQESSALDGPIKGLDLNFE